MGSDPCGRFGRTATGVDETQPNDPAGDGGAVVNCPLMSRTDYEDRAYRRRVGVLLVSFLCALPTLLAVAVYLVVIHFLPTQGWLDTIMFLLQLLPFILVGAGGIAIGMTYVVDFPDLLRGRFRCERCGRAAGRMAGFCPCDFPAIPRRPKRYWTHYRRRLKALLLLYCAILGIALIFLGTSPAPRRYPFLADLLLAHAVLCALVAVILHMAVSVLEFLKRARRWQLRAGVFVRMLAVWPAVVAIAMILVTSMGWV